MVGLMRKTLAQVAGQGIAMMQTPICDVAIPGVASVGAVLRSALAIWLSGFSTWGIWFSAAGVGCGRIRGGLRFAIGIVLAVCLTACGSWESRLIANEGNADLLQSRHDAYAGKRMAAIESAKRQELAYRSQPDLDPVAQYDLAIWLGELQMQEANYVEAQRHFDEALSICVRAGLEDVRGRYAAHGHRDAEAMRNLAVDVSESWSRIRNDIKGARERLSAGDYRGSTDLVERAVQAVRSVSGIPAAERAEQLRTASELWISLGNYRTACRLAHEARAELWEVNNHEDTRGSFAALVQLAECESQMGDFNASLEYAERALAAGKFQVGSHPRSQVRARLNLATAFHLLDRSEKAINAYNTAKEVVEQLYGPQSYVRAIPLSRLGRTYTDLQKLDLAEELLKQSYEINLAHFGECSIEVADVTEQLSELCLRSDRNDEALGFARNAYDVKRFFLGEEHPNVSDAQLQYAITEITTGQTKTGSELIEKVIKARREFFGVNSVKMGSGLRLLSSAKRIEGKNDLAIENARESVRVLSALLGRSHIETLDSVETLARAHMTAGNLLVAEGLFSEVIWTIGQSKTTDTIVLSRALDGRGIVAYRRGDFQTAISCLSKAIDLQKQVSMRSGAGRVFTMTSLASAYAEIRDVSEAARISKAVVDDCRRLHGGVRMNTFALFCSAINALGDVGEFEYSRSVVADLEKFAAQTKLNSSQVIAFESAKAFLQSKEGKAIESYGTLAALESYLSAAAVPEASVYRIKTNLFSLRCDIGDGLGAITDFDDYISRTPDTANYLEDLKLSQIKPLMQLGAVERVERELRSQLSTGLEKFGRLSTAGTEMSKIRSSSRRRFRVEAWLSLARQTMAAIDIYSMVVNWKSLHVDQSQRNEADESEIVAKRKKLHDLTQKLSSLMYRSATNDAEGDGLQEFESTALEREAIERELLEADVVRSNEIVSVESLQQACDEGELLLDFWSIRPHLLNYDRDWDYRYRRAIVCFAISRDRVAMFQIGDEEDIQRLVSEWRDAITSGDRHAEKTLSENVSERLWTPIVKSFGRVSRIVVCPEGPISAVPWGALRTDGGRFLIEQCNVVLVTSLKNVVRKEGAATLNVSEAAPPSILLVGDVDYSGQQRAASPSVSNVGAFRNERLGVLSDLPGSRIEIDTINSLFEKKFPNGAVVRLERDLATENNFRALSHRKRYVHLATHGFFSPPNLNTELLRYDNVSESRVGVRPRFAHPGLLGGIAFVPIDPDSNFGWEDGIMTSLEAQGCDLFGTELVVLSACDSGVGFYANGEGVIGLQRAFHRAGAARVISSLWSVNDDASAELMTRFYAALWGDSLDPADALRVAQLSMIKSPRRFEGSSKLRVPDFGQSTKVRRPKTDNGAFEYSDPRFWAGFVVSKSPQN